MSTALPSPVIVVPAFQRAACLAGLLAALRAAHYPHEEVRLHFSLEFGCAEAVVRLIADFDWPHGAKVVECHTQRLGLREHLLHCGGLAERYGAVIVLEDDLVVAPDFYAFAQAALQSTASDTRIAGVALYSYAITENTQLPFSPQNSPGDEHYLQVPCSWGQAFTASQWEAFRKWNDHTRAEVVDALVPDYVKIWGAQSWKKRFFAYLIAEDKYFLYPAFALSTNPGIAGTHTDAGGVFQVPLQMGQRPWHFAGLDQADGIYDAWFELLPAQIKKVCPALAPYDFSMDLYGQKTPEVLQTPFVLTTRPALVAEQSYGAQLLPPIANVIAQRPGHWISLARTAEVAPQPLPPQQWLAALEGPSLAHSRTLTPTATISFSILLPCLDEGPDPLLLQELLDAYPRTELLLVGGTAMALEPRFRHHPQVRVITPPPHNNLEQAYLAAYAQATGSILFGLLPGQRIRAELLPEIAHLFRHFSDLDWLSTLPRSHRKPKHFLRAMRWDANRAKYSQSHRFWQHFQSGHLFFRRHAWLRATSSTSPATLTELWLKLFETTALHTADLSLDRQFGKPIGMAPLKRSPLKLPPGQGGLRALSAHLLRKAYLYNIPLLRQAYLSFSHLPPLLRKDQATGKWFRSEH